MKRNRQQYARPPLGPLVDRQGPDPRQHPGRRAPYALKSASGERTLGGLGKAPADTLTDTPSFFLTFFPTHLTSFFLYYLHTVGRTFSLKHLHSYTHIPGLLGDSERHADMACRLACRLATRLPRSGGPSLRARPPDVAPRQSRPPTAVSGGGSQRPGQALPAALVRRGCAPCGRASVGLACGPALRFSPLPDGPTVSPSRS